MKKKMLILIDTMKPKVDGVSIFLDNVLQTFTEKYDVSIIAPNYGDGSYENAKLIKFPTYKFGEFDYGITKVNKKILKREVKNCDFIFNHESVTPFTPSFYALRYARKYKKPIFTYVHSIDWELANEILLIPSFFKYFVRIFLKLYARWFFNRCNAVIVPFKTIEDILRENNISGRFEIVPVGVSDLFKPGKSKFSIKDKIVIGYSGRVSREKRLDLLLKVFLKLKEKYGNLFLLIVGDGPYRSMFEAIQDVKITGFVSQEEVAEYLRAMDIFVIPSVTETSSISTIEATKTGLCCLTRDTGCIGDYLKDGHSGYFFKNDEELGYVLEKLIKDKKLRRNVGKKARESVLQYKWDNTAKGLIEIFEKNLEKSQ